MLSVTQIKTEERKLQAILCMKLLIVVLGDGTIIL
jgi:hypothetical protein